MSILIDASASDLADGKAFIDYKNYINSIKSELSESVFSFAIDPQKYTADGSLHDAWVEEIIIHEFAEGERRETRRQEITIKLLGSYHDRNIVIRYLSVKSFHLNASDLTHGHGDWLMDEISYNGKNPIHTIIFSSGSKLEIVFDNIEVREELFTVT